LDSADEDHIFDPQNNIVRASILMEATRTPDADAMENAGSAEETAIQRTFDPDNMLKRVLLPKCVEAGIPLVQSRMSLAEIKDVVRKFYIKLHDREGLSLYKSDCYIAKTQSIERKRKQTTAQKTKSKFAATIALKGNPCKVLRPTRKKGMALKGVLAKFPDKGFYIVAPIHGNRVVRYRCNQKIISG
jgi:hypothetical protein